MKAELINQRISQLRKKGKRVLTNAFGRFVWDKETECVLSDDSIVVCELDHGVRRLLFYTVDIADLVETIKIIKPDSMCCLEILSKNKEELGDVLQSAGLVPKSYMMRMSNNDIGEVLSQSNGVMELWEEGHGVTPDFEDAATINKVLWDVFDTRVSHLLDDDEIMEAIKLGQFKVEKKSNKIVSILQVQCEPKKFYINQIYNSLHREVIHSILIQELKKYYENGGKYLFAWVEETNIASVKFHAKYGMKHDGLWNVVYVGKDEN